MGCLEFVHMRQILQGPAVRREDLVIACDRRRRAEEELGARPWASRQLVFLVDICIRQVGAAR